MILIKKKVSVFGKEKRKKYVSDNAQLMSEWLLRESNFRGIDRKIVEVDTPYGMIRRKDYAGYGVMRSKYEYEDLARIAKEHQMSIAELLKNIES